ncbi:serine/threonine-protein phosphatase [Corynebacterium sp. CNCTC7651]|nr:protein phosphatase 2C domain-containing protein [Corynebacterium sp. CNCTC7651]UIZ92183.1 serine/threonine-protein phosphatase [Corynebacterium sp. CNCTC7651]
MTTPAKNTQQRLRLDFVAASDRGLVRGNNEDSAYAGPHLLALADGMGGHAAGEVASQLMVTHLEHLDKEPGDADLLALLGAAAEDANAAIEDSAAQHPEQQGMGTTLTALMFNGTAFGMIHVGDSRGYLLRDGQLTQLTVDDTFVQSLVNEGKLNAEDVSSHPQKSLILKAYTGRPVEPHLEMVEAKAGDRVLLCSDGLSDPVTNETIAVALDQGSPEIAAQRLVELALRSGGPDNITVVVADVVAGEAPASEKSPSPAIVGALAPSYEPTHPNSSASRAAALLRKSETIQPDHNRAKLQPAEGGATLADSGAAGADEEGPHRPKRTVWPWVVGALLLALILVFAGVMWVQNRTSDQYFVSVDEDGAFVIEHGSKQDREGIQRACIDEKNQLRIVNVEVEDSSSCNLFKQEDLPESQRGTAERFGGGTYDDVLGLLGRLADEALPVCVDKSGAEKASANGSANAATAACREVR